MKFCTKISSSIPMNCVRNFVYRPIITNIINTDGMCSLVIGYFQQGIAAADMVVPFLTQLLLLLPLLLLLLLLLLLHCNCLQQ